LSNPSAGSADGCLAALEVGLGGDFRASDAMVERRYDGSGDVGDVRLDAFLDDAGTFVCVS